ncbi:MAG: hypothetical protein LQ343_006427 [Gyalolechia ehrenbergii]|nr:MAG: hypothetical protein LQ343_006427 [Gyalolechia ehrenbergii]
MNGINDDVGPLYFQRITEELHTRSQNTNAFTTLFSALSLILLAYQTFYWLDYPILPMSELLWNSAIYATPTKVISALESTLLPSTSDKPGDDAEQSKSITHARKSETMKRLLGLDGTGMLSKVQRAKSLPAVSTLLKSASNGSPPGLGNWDNSCYQNSIIQGLASLPSFSAFLHRSSPDHSSTSTKAALNEIIEKLKHESNLGTMFWTPAQLKSMSSWQQQDAQEYFSKLMDEVEKETAGSSAGRNIHNGLATIREISVDPTKSSSTRLRTAEENHSPSSEARLNISHLPGELQSVIATNPFEGLLAQRVGCLKCGFVEGLSLIPFNCLTLPLGKHWLYDIRRCMDEYTALEPINGVDCAKCTLLQSKLQLEKLRSQFSDDTGRELQSSVPLVTEALKASVEERLAAVKDALENEDFSDNTILKKCQISQKSKVSSTKTRQAVIARAPKSLAIHINRSVFDEMTGMLSKNHADVRFPLRFSLASWCLGGRPRKSENGHKIEHWNTIPSESMLAGDTPGGGLSSSDVYELRAALTHYGRHENGHYICYRRHETSTNVDSSGSKASIDSWWRFSDEDVSPVSEDNVLAQGGVFMLFYERINGPQLVPSSGPHPVEEQISKTTSETMCSQNDETAATVEGSSELISAQVKVDIGARDESKADRHIVPPPEQLADVETRTTEADSTLDIEQPSLDTKDAVTPTSSHSLSPDTPTAEAPPLPASSPQAKVETESDPAPLPPSPAPRQTEHRPSLSHSMRTATPRSGRGNKGMGQVSSSSMVTAN